MFDLRPQSPLERYLRRATRGIWGRKRLEVCEELQAHILERAKAFSIGGLPCETAVERVLAELGEPQLVNRGMLRIHTLPLLLPAAALLSLGISALLLQHPLMVQTIQDGPSASCWSNLEVCQPDDGWVWISRSSLQKTLEAKDVVWQQAEQLHLQFPGAEPFNFDQAYQQAGSLLNHLRFDRGGETYWVAHTLVQAIAHESTLPVKLSGWESPVLMVGSTRVNLGQYGELWIPRLYRELLANRFAKFNREVKVSGPYRHRLKVVGEPGTIYGLLTPSLQGSLRSAIGAVGLDGILQLDLPWPQITFAPSAELPYNLPGQPAKVLLLRFTGQLGVNAPFYVVEQIARSFAEQ